MELRIRPEPPDRDIEAAVRRAVERRPSAPTHRAYRSAWRQTGLDYAAARPRSNRGATRA